jgi:hypothetical protein
MMDKRIDDRTSKNDPIVNALFNVWLTQYRKPSNNSNDSDAEVQQENDSEEDL